MHNQIHPFFDFFMFCSSITSKNDLYFMLYTFKHSYISNRVLFFSRGKTWFDTTFRLYENSTNTLYYIDVYFPSICFGKYSLHATKRNTTSTSSIFRKWFNWFFWLLQFVCKHQNSTFTDTMDRYVLIPLNRVLLLQLLNAFLKGSFFYWRRRNLEVPKSLFLKYIFLLYTKLRARKCLKWIFNYAIFNHTIPYSIPSMLCIYLRVKISWKNL